MPAPLKLSDFDYALPDELIAQAPARTRSASRLLDVDGEALHDRRFADLPSLLRAGDLAVFNDTRVIHARAIGRKPSGGRVEMLVERLVGDDAAWAQLRASHLPKPGGRVDFAGGAHAIVEAREDRFFRLRFHGAGRLADWLERHGEVPLPPYITRPGDADDAMRYQTVYARAPGAVAAPTAGLHFDAATLAALAARGRGQRVRDAARRRRDVPAGHDRGPVAAPHAQRALRDTGGDGAGDRGDARSAAGASSRSARRRCGHSSRRSTHRDGSAPARPRRHSSSRRGFASASSTCCSPTSTCPARRC